MIETDRELLILVGMIGAAGAIVGGFVPAAFEAWIERGRRRGRALAALAVTMSHFKLLTAKMLAIADTWDSHKALSISDADVKESVDTREYVFEAAADLEVALSADELAKAAACPSGSATSSTRSCLRRRTGFQGSGTGVDRQSKGRRRRCHQAGIGPRRPLRASE